MRQLQIAAALVTPLLGTAASLQETWWSGQPLHSATSLLGIPRSLCHDPILSRNGASGNPGAIQPPFLLRGVLFGGLIPRWSRESGRSRRLKLSNLRDVALHCGR